MIPTAQLLDLALRMTRELVDFPGEVTVAVSGTVAPGPVLVEVFVDSSDIEKTQALRAGILAALEGAAGCSVELRIETRGLLIHQRIRAGADPRETPESIAHMLEEQDPMVGEFEPVWEAEEEFMRQRAELRIETRGGLPDADHTAEYRDDEVWRECESCEHQWAAAKGYEDCPECGDLDGNWIRVPLGADDADLTPDDCPEMQDTAHLRTRDRRFSLEVPASVSDSVAALRETNPPKCEPDCPEWSATVGRCRVHTIDGLEKLV